MSYGLFWNLEREVALLCPNRELRDLENDRRMLRIAIENMEDPESGRPNLNRLQRIIDDSDDLRNRLEQFRTELLNDFSSGLDIHNTESVLNRIIDILEDTNVISSASAVTGKGGSDAG